MAERENARHAAANAWRWEPRGKSVRLSKIPDYDSLPYKGEVPHYDAVINYSRLRDKGSVRCVMCGSRPNKGGACEIPRQNKDVCKTCDREVFKHVASSIVFKWCKGCKRFLNLAAFAEKPDAAKCFGCRERGRKCYLVKKYLMPAPAAAASIPRSRSDSTAECLTDGDDFSSEGENDSASGARNDTATRNDSTTRNDSATRGRGAAAAPPPRRPRTRNLKQRPAAAPAPDSLDEPRGGHCSGGSSSSSFSFSQQPQPWCASLGPSPCTSAASANSLSDGDGHFCGHGSEESDLDDNGHEAATDAYDDCEERAVAVQGLRRLCSSLALGGDSAADDAGAGAGSAEAGSGSNVPAAATAAAAEAPQQAEIELAEIRERVIQILKAEAVEAALKQARQAAVTWAAEASRLATQLYSLRHGAPATAAAGQVGSAASEREGFDVAPGLGAGIGASVGGASVEAGLGAGVEAGVPLAMYLQEEPAGAGAVLGKKRKMEDGEAPSRANRFAAVDVLLVLPAAATPAETRAPMGAAF